MVDKTRALKIENPVSGGSQTNVYPTETDPSQDYSAVKGIAFNNDDNQLIDYVGRMISGKTPDTWQKLTYLGNGQLDYLEFFNSVTFINANRLAKITMSYDANLQPTTEVCVVYDTDGTTVLRTITTTYTFSSMILQSSKTAVT